MQEILTIMSILACQGIACFGIITITTPKSAAYADRMSAGWEMQTMTETTDTRLLIAAPQGVAAKLQGILDAAGITPEAVFSSGEEALAFQQAEQALLLTSWRLPDMTGPELAGKINCAGVMMIVPGDYDPKELEGADVLTLHNPISQDALIQAVRAMCYCGAKLRALDKKAKKLERQLSERKVIERAKGKLMDALHLTEREAHYSMQKKSMDTGRRIVEIAQEILDSEEVVA